MNTSKLNISLMQDINKLFVTYYLIYITHKASPP
jgi:hypothetical protein